VAEPIGEAGFQQPLPTGLLQGQLDDAIAAFTGDGFALGSLWRRRAQATAARLHPERLLRGLGRTMSADRDAVPLAPLLHTDVARAGAALGKQGVTVELVEVADRSEALGHDLVPRTVKGGTATLYTMGGVVVGVSGDRPTISLRDTLRTGGEEQPSRARRPRKGDDR
jgi:hypothetical protein